MTVLNNICSHSVSVVGKMSSPDEETPDDPERNIFQQMEHAQPDNGTATVEKLPRESNSDSIPGTSSGHAANFTPVLPPTEPGIIPKLHNVVAAVDLGCKLDLLRIALYARNAEYNPKRFSAVIMRIREPRTAALIFSSGKMVVTGARNEDASNLAARKYARIIQKLGFNVKFINFKIHNMVGSCDVKFPIQLERLYSNHSQFSRYEPELFPGLVYRMVKPKVVLLIFVSGKVVLTGAKSRSDMYEAFGNAYPTLKAFRKQ